MRFLKSTIITSALLICSCSVYESGGRKAIETNENNIVGSYGFSQSLTEYYICEQQSTEPEFLKSPLEVIDTPFDSKNITPLYNSSATPPAVIVYTVNANSIYTFCRISTFTPATRSLLSSKIQQMAQLAHTQLDKLLSATRP